MVFSYLVWGGTRRYGGVGRKSRDAVIHLLGHKSSMDFHETDLAVLKAQEKKNIYWLRFFSERAY